MNNALERFFKAAGCQTQVELAEFLSIRQSSISDAKKRKVIPAEWLLKLLRKKGVNPDWILTGQGPQMLQPANWQENTLPQPVYINQLKLPADCSIEELVIEIVRKVLGKEPHI